MTLTTRIRTALVGAAAGTALVAAAVPAAAEPAAACPQPYELFLIPSDGSRPVAANLDAKGNQDGYACQKPFSDSASDHTGAPDNVIDNRVAR